MEAPENMNVNQSIVPNGFRNMQNIDLGKTW
jgi:hypothetical protein